jgi:hypothetical protein
LSANGIDVSKACARLIGVLPISGAVMQAATASAPNTATVIAIRTLSERCAVTARPGVVPTTATGWVPITTCAPERR